MAASDLMLRQGVLPHISLRVIVGSSKSEVFFNATTISATYEHGVFVPRTPVNLPEHTEVKLLLPKTTTKRNQLAAAEKRFLALRGISHDLAGTDSVAMQKKIRGEWRGQ